MPNLSRRALLAGAASVATTPAFAAAPVAGVQAPGFYRSKLGDFELTQIADGAATFPIPDGFVANVPKDKVIAAAARAFLAAPGQVRVPFSPLLINTGSKLVLIDTGYGPNIGPVVGHLPKNLAAAGITPDMIDTVIISHIHPDHTNGLKNKDCTPAFPKAEILMPEVDWAFWMSEENAAKATSPIDKGYFANAQKTLSDLKGHVSTYAWGKEATPGITALDTSGHTPGHTSFVIASGKDKLFVQSDVTNIPAFFLAHPDWHVMYDHDAEKAEKTRRRFYDMAATEKALVIGYHFAFPCAGHIEKTGKNYRLVPVAWTEML
jgi:glyoxylase-like metal-dependent hydrolase (beta-lactamase superfamily II)